MQILVAGFFIDSANAQADCPNGEDYSPCECSRPPSPGGLPAIICPIKIKTNLADVFNTFKRTKTADFETMSISILPQDKMTEMIIPMDLFNNHRARNFEINCGSSSNLSLRVDSQAFRSSITTAQSMRLTQCDLNQLSFDFLSGFNQINYIWFPATTNVGLANWNTFPLLHSLNKFAITHSTGLNEWTTFPKLSRGLNHLFLKSNDIQDAAMDRILNWAANYSAETLEELQIDDNDLKNIPRQFQILSFTKLNSFYMNNQKTGIPIIKSGSIRVSPDVILHAENNKIVTIEEGAFQGNYIRQRRKNTFFLILTLS